MKVNLTSAPHNKKESPACSFTSAGLLLTQGLRALEVSPAWGAVAVDLASMTGPRTAVDFIERGPAIGTETGIQQGSSTLNHALLGVYGTGAGLASAWAINKAYGGIEAHRIFASSNVVDTFGEVFKKAFEKNSDTAAEETLRKILGSVETNPGNTVKISQETINEIADIHKNTSITDKKSLKEFEKRIHSLILSDTGSESNFKIVNPKNGKASVLSLQNFIDNTFSILKTFKEDKVKEAFANGNGDKFLKSLNSMGIKRSALGLGIAGVIGLSMQPLNTYRTKKRTGSDGFVGVAGRTKDRSPEFNMLKTTLALGGFAGVLANIGKPSQWLDKLQFKGMSPTLEQFKLIYGLTIASRFIATRDKDELREAAVRDTIGYLSWLVMGNFVSKGVTKMADKSLIKESWEGKGFFKSTLLTRDEVLQKALKENKIPTVKDGKALSFKDMMKELKALSQNKEAAAALKKLRIISWAQAAGYLYSGVVLGFLLPKLNIYMTNKSEVKRQARIAAQRNSMGMFAPENSAFIKQNLTKQFLP
ncbi:MAG: hypothetical protein LBK53_01795 [Heliobacteriaceae bacterium]|jgi:hypothetical protein|nr:hypothetical protein [Heliobacteriaceae bacterium]